MRVESIAHRAAAYGIDGVRVDGMDVEAVYDTAREVIDRVRSGGGPVLVEADCYRFSGHSKSDRFVYRTREEEERWARRDPLPNARERLLADGMAEAELGAREKSVREAVARAHQTAREAAEPGPEDVLVSPYAEPLTDE
jgi:pyruvate dehydrogenase E1 component alpha subunit